MSVRPIDFNGMIQNTQEAASNRSQEQNKPLVQQEMTTISMDAQVEESTHQVHEQDDTGAESALDPDGESGGSFSRRKKKKNTEEKKKKRHVSDGRVSLKNAHKSFDVTI